MTKRDRLELAFAELIRLIESGWEFPDAKMSVCARFNVTSDFITAAYDEYCAD